MEPIQKKKKNFCSVHKFSFWRSRTRFKGCNRYLNIGNVFSHDGMLGTNNKSSLKFTSPNRKKAKTKRNTYSPKQEYSLPKKKSTHTKQGNRPMIHWQQFEAHVCFNISAFKKIKNMKAVARW